MSTRIRYKLVNDGEYKDGDENSSDYGARVSGYIPVTNGEARVMLYPHQRFAIIHLSNGTDIRVEGTSMHKIKIKVKDKLIEMGAQFLDEKRDEHESE